MLSEYSKRIDKFFEPGSAIILGNWDFRLTMKSNYVLEHPEMCGCLEYSVDLDKMTEQDHENYNMMRKLCETVFGKPDVYQVDKSYFQHGKARLYIFYDEETIWRQGSDPLNL